MTTVGPDSGNGLGASSRPRDRGGDAAAQRIRLEQNWILGICALFFAAIYVVFWPHTNTTMDESSYLGFAYVLRHGTLYADRINTPILLSLPVHGHLVSKYPLGMSGLLALTSLGGWTFAFGTNLLVHLASYVVVIRLLRHFKLSPFYALLYLLHPTAVLYSRTVMSDLASGLILALAFEQYLARRFALTGALLGLSVVFRTANAVAFPLFLLGVVIEQEAGLPGSLQNLRTKLRLAASLVIGSLPFLALVGYYSAVVAGGQMAKSTGTFGLKYFPIYFPGYVLALLVIYPGMLIAPAFYRGRGKFILASLCYSFVVIYSFWYFRDEGGNVLESLIVGQRYFLAVLPLFILAYGMMLDRLMSCLPTVAVRRAVATFALVVMAIISVMVQKRHAAHLKEMIAIRDALVNATTEDDVIYCNTQVAKLLPPWSGRRFVQPTDAAEADRATIDRLLASDRAVSGNSSARPRIIFATWMREGRADDRADGERVEALGREFPTEPISTPLATDLHVRYIIEGRADNRSADTPAKTSLGTTR